MPFSSSRTFARTLQTAIARWVASYRVPVLGLALVRIFYAATALLLALPNFTWISQAPSGLFDPPLMSIPALWGGFPGYGFLQLLSVLVCVLYILLLFGYRTRWTSLCLSAALILGFSFVYSFGKIDHNILVVVFPAVMAFSGWGRALSVDAHEMSRPSMQRATRGEGAVAYGVGWPVALMALLIGFGYFSAGVGKLAWLDFDPTTHGARSWLIKGYFVDGRQAFAAPLFVAIDSPYFWEAMDLLALTFEIGFLFSVLHVRLFKTFVAAAVLFHITNYMMLNISFAAMIRIYPLFLPWWAIVHGVGADVWRRWRRWRPQARWMGLGLAVYVPLYVLAQFVVGAVDPAQQRYVAPLEAVCTLVPGLDYGMLHSFVLFGAGVLGLGAALYAVRRARRAAHAPPRPAAVVASEFDPRQPSVS